MQLHSEVLITLLSSQEVTARRAAIKALEQWPAEVAMVPIAGCLTDSDSGVRVSAIVAIGNYGVTASEYHATFEKIANEDQDFKIQAVAKWAMNKTQQPTQQPCFLEALRELRPLSPPSRDEEEAVDEAMEDEDTWANPNPNPNPNWRQWKMKIHGLS